MVEYAPLIPLFPLIAAVLIGLFGAKVLKGHSHWIAILGIAASAVIALGTLMAFNGGAGPRNTVIFEWIHAGKFQADVGFYVDQLTALYISFITGIGLLIFIYASGYMKGDFGYFRFFAYLSLFVFFMTCLVLGNNFIMLYLGWEGVGLASYLLIGYYYPKPSAVAAAKKAFITNRVGDFGFAIGIFMTYLAFGSVNYVTVFDPQAIHDALTYHPWVIYIPFLLMIGAFGKSAQFPLHVWLPDAMEGPTPVSALIHAATMVTAGIYMIARCLPLFNLNPNALLVVGCVGAFTAFLAASIALCQYDLKRIWAYSTLSQLGYMFLGLGVSASVPAVFHVFTHAFFKALLFLAAGSVMHAMGGELDIRKMSGIKKYMPITCWTMFIGCLALAGFPGLAGFFSKDEILAAAVNHPTQLGQFLGLIGLLVALMTAYYTFRLWFRVFMGPELLPANAGGHEASPFDLPGEGHGHHGHHHTTDHANDAAKHLDVGETEASHGADSHGHATHGHHGTPNDGPISMWFPLIILAIGAVTVGYLGVFGGEAGHEGGWIHHLLGPVLNPSVEGHAEEAAPRFSHLTMQIISSILAIVGIGIAYYFHLANRQAATNLAKSFSPIVKFLENKWYIDELYHAVLLAPLRVLAIGLSYFDRFVVDALVFVVGFIPQLMGYSLKPTQRGLLQRYATFMVAGIAAMVLGVLLVLLK